MKKVFFLGGGVGRVGGGGPIGRRLVAARLFFNVHKSFEFKPRLRSLQLPPSNV